MDKNIQTNSIFYSTLKQEIEQTKEAIKSIKPSGRKIRRSINVLGTAWKYLAGTPDHDDFAALEYDTKQLNDNNNKQFLVNQALTERMNNLTVITDRLTNAITKDSYLNDELVISIQNRLRLVKEEIVNVRYAIQWAKLKLVNSILLNKKELELTLKTLEEERMPFSSTEEALSFAETSVLYNSTMLAYIVKIPITGKETYENILIKPVKRNNTFINIVFNNIIKKENNILGINSECKTINSISICNKDQIVSLVNETCITKLLNSKQNPTCQYSNANHVKPIEILQRGLILLNNFNGTVNNSLEEMSVAGTFVVKFSNLTIKINNDSFYNGETLLTGALPVRTQFAPAEKERINLLSLESIHELFIDNIKRLDCLQNNTNTTQISVAIMAILTLAAFSIIFFCHRRKQIILQTSFTSETSSKCKDPAVPEIVPKTANPITYFNFDKYHFFDQLRTIDFKRGGVSNNNI